MATTEHKIDAKQVGLDLREAVRLVVEQREAELEDVELRIRELRSRRRQLRSLLAIMRDALEKSEN